MENTHADKPQEYQIKVQGNLDESWTSWFSGLTISTEKDRVGHQITTLRGKIIDQAALRGLLNKLWDLNQSLVSVSRLD